MRGCRYSFLEHGIRAFTTHARFATRETHSRSKCGAPASRECNFKELRNIA
jgi:hypothetical protein